MSLFCLKRPILAILCSLIAAPALSDKVNEPWQSRREAANALTDKACAGDPNAVRKVWNLIEVQNDPVMQNNLGWLSANCKSFDVSTKEQAQWQQKAAAVGYPIAQGGYGIRLLRGDGVRKQSAAGVAMLLEAYKGGNANAMADLSIFFAYGKYVQKNLKQAQTYYKIAEKAGADSGRLKQARNALAENGGSASSSASKGGVCYLALEHRCDMEPIDPYALNLLTIYAEKQTPSIAFKGCEKYERTHWTINSDGEMFGYKDDGVPSRQVREVESVLRKFRDAVIYYHPSCVKNTLTEARLYPTADRAFSSVKSTVDLRNTPSFESSWY